MLIFERQIIGIICYRVAFFPTREQIRQLVEHLRPFDVLRAVSAPAAGSNDVRPIVRGAMQTTLVDLSKGPDAIFAGMHANCRYKVRRAEKMRERIEIAMNSDAAVSDFLVLYNSFVRVKRKIPAMKPRRLNAYLPHADIFMLYFDGQPTCGRLVLRDVEARTALMQHSATRRLEPGADTIQVGLLNRYLHWHEMKTYHAAGMEKYDFGGAGSANPSVTQFKRSFGGQLTTYYNELYAGIMH
jgi:GNAT acetyltransferase-like protein